MELQATLFLIVKTCLSYSHVPSLRESHSKFRSSIGYSLYCSCGLPFAWLVCTTRCARWRRSCCSGATLPAVSFFSLQAVTHTIHTHLPVATLTSMCWIPIAIKIGLFVVRFLSLSPHSILTEYHSILLVSCTARPRVESICLPGFLSKSLQSRLLLSLIWLACLLGGKSTAAVSHAWVWL